MDAVDWTLVIIEDDAKFVFRGLVGRVTGGEVTIN